MKPTNVTALSHIQEAEQQLRDLINAPRRHRAIVADRPRFHQLCAALDAIGDSELAIQAFAATHARDHGEMYLRIYGVLQACVLQQDAVRHAAESLDVPWTLPDDAWVVRGIREPDIARPGSHPPQSTSLLPVEHRPTEQDLYQTRKLLPIKVSQAPLAVDRLIAD